MFVDPELNDSRLAGLDLKTPRFMTRTRVDSAQLSLGICILNIGLIIGVSFIATPIKFSAETLSLPAALDVGRVTFGLFHTIEWVTFGALSLFVLSRPNPFSRTPLQTGLIVALGLILCLDGVWLLPELSERVQAVINGVPRPASPHHALYASLELLKTGILAALAQRQLARLAPSQDDAWST